MLSHPSRKRASLSWWLADTLIGGGVYSLSRRRHRSAGGDQQTNRRDGPGRGRPSGRFRGPPKRTTLSVLGAETVTGAGPHLSGRTSPGSDGPRGARRFWESPPDDHQSYIQPGYHVNVASQLLAGDEPQWSSVLEGSTRCAVRYVEEAPGGRNVYAPRCLVTAGDWLLEGSYYGGRLPQEVDLVIRVEPPIESGFPSLLINGEAA